MTVPGMMAKQPEKTCADLPVTAPQDDPHGSAKDNGSYPLAESRALRGGTRSALGSFRPANGAGPAVRHVLD